MSSDVRVQVPSSAPNQEVFQHERLPDFFFIFNGLLSFFCDMIISFMTPELHTKNTILHTDLHTPPPAILIHFCVRINKQCSAEPTHKRDVAISALTHILILALGRNNLPKVISWDRMSIIQNGE